MKKTLLALFVAILLSACTKSPLPDPATGKDPIETGNHPKGDSLQRLLKKHLAKGLPGAVIAIKDGQGQWTGAGGFARMEDGTRMHGGMLQIGRSITKIVTATAIMQLKEKGRIVLDAPIRTYLPENLKHLVPQTGTVTVRMLLNHTSGYNEYVDLPEFQQRWLDNPLTTWSENELQRLIRKRCLLLFEPGTDYRYSNINYYLLAQILDQVTGKPHGHWFQQHIFNPLGLQDMYYKHSPGYPDYRNRPDFYYPRFDNGVLENNTAATLAWEKSEEYGTVGLVATPDNYLRLLQGLVEGRLVNAASLAEMKQWVQGSGSSEPDYGLGLSYWGYGSKPNFGHDGDGIGCHTILLYFPGSQTYLFLAVNAPIVFGGRMQQIISEFQNETGNYLASF
ncbi:MAG TPA: serine hydrolase domain-containing protein [Chitinophagaceae bacterium]|nr:serine hydrolase domain-containing protein [Chitinophagaceae bacterium]